MTAHDCPFGCGWTPEHGPHDPPVGDQRADHVNEQHPDVVHAIYTGECSDSAIGALRRLVVSEELSRRQTRAD